MVAAQCLLRRLYCSCPVWACADQHCIAQQRLETPQHWQRLWREARIRRAETRTTILLSTWPQVCPAAPRLSTGATLRDEPTAPQQLASGMGHASIVRTLIRHGASPAVDDDIGETPLHLAATVGQEGTAHELLALGADVNQKSKDG